jgi:hypothetical protein
MRFFAWSVTFKFLRFVHCRRCGNLDLQRVSNHHVEGWSAVFFRIAHVPAYRCGPCRFRFFSFLSHRRIRPVDTEIPELDDSAERAQLRTTESAIQS